MELRNLITFVRTAELQNFSKTAEQLGYSQSAVTMQIKQLEKELGTQLFERIGRHVRLTETGERLLPYAIDVLNAVSGARSITQEPDRISGRLRIGASESLAAQLLPPVIMELADTCPDLEINIYTGPTMELFDMLRQNDVDIIFFIDKKFYFSDMVKVMEEPSDVVFVASPDSPLAGQKNISVEQLLQEPFYLIRRGVTYCYELEQELASRGFELHPFLEFGKTAVLTRFILKNKGVSFMPEYVVDKYLKDGSLVTLDTELGPLTMYNQLAYHRKKYVTRQMQLFIDLMNSHPAGTFL